LTVARFIEDRTGWSIRKFVRTAHRAPSTSASAPNY
jgi:hypothetical protein